MAKNENEQISKANQVELVDRYTSNCSEETEFFYQQTTDNIRILASASHLSQNSEPGNGIFAFSYTIKIENLGSETVQLLERHWVIYSNGVRIAEVVGPGVVGLQPVLAAGESHQYSSSAVIQDPHGSMEGTYTFKNMSGKYFEVKIPKFDLLYPVILH